MNGPLEAMRCGLTAVAPEDIVLSVIAVKGGARTAAELFNDLKSTLEPAQSQAAFNALVADSKAVTGASGKVALTGNGIKDVVARFGKLPTGKRGMSQLKNVVWPALALGIDPKSKSGSRLVKTENLRAVALAVVFDLPTKKDNATLPAVTAALFLRGLTGVAGPRAAAQPQIKAIAQNASDLAKPDNLRKLIIKAALTMKEEAVPARLQDELHSFAGKVQAVANKLSTPPFSHKIAIAQLYDAYGREHTDAGPLNSFKSRLLEANTEGLLNLYPLDEPEGLDPELRSRSLIDSHYGRYHFVARS